MLLRRQRRKSWSVMLEGSVATPAVLEIPSNTLDCNITSFGTFMQKYMQFSSSFCRQLSAVNRSTLPSALMHISITTTAKFQSISVVNAITRTLLSCIPPPSDLHLTRWSALIQMVCC